MSTRLITSLVLAMIFSIFGNSNPSLAESSQRVLVAAVDYSSSMHASPYLTGINIPSHLSVQTTAFVNALEGPLANCQFLTIEYLMWGETTREPIRVDLADEVEKNDFVVRLQTDLFRVNLSGTKHQYAWAKAVTVAREAQAEKVAIIFITDEVGQSVILPAPAGTYIYKVAIDTGQRDDVRTYLKTRLVPGQGEVFRASNAAELTAILDLIFAEIGINFCLS